MASRAMIDESTRARGGSHEAPASARSTRRWTGWTGLTGLAVLVLVWVVANVAWLQANRGARLWDHEEVGYVRQVASFGRLRQLSSIWDGLHSGYTGPIQTIFGAPSQWLFGVDAATVIWVNIAMTAVTGVMVYWAVRRLAGRGAALAASALVLVVPGMLENAHGALTMVPATTFAAAAVAVLVAGGGLARWRWSIVLGVVIGALSLSRSMAFSFVPGLAVPAIVWSRTLGTPRRTVIRNGLVAGAVAVAASIWWWAISYDDVLEYLAVGSPNVETANPVAVLISRVAEIVLYLGPWVPLIAAIAYIVLARGQRRAAAVDVESGAEVLGAGPVRAAGPAPTAVEPDPDATDPGGSADPPRRSLPTDRGVARRAVDADLHLWPLWAAVGVDLLVSLVSNTVGWLMLPLVPWLVIAAFAGARRSLDTRSWRVWAAVVVGPAVVIAVLTSTVWIKPGNRFTWCQEPIMNTSACAIDDDAEAARWRTSIDTVTDEAFALHENLLTSGRRADIAIAARDHIVLPSSIQLAAELRHQWNLDAYRFFPLDQSPEAQLDEVRRDADIVIVSPDVEPVVLTKAMYDPDELADQLVGHGFADCRSVTLPDGRVVRTLVREPLPPDLCG